MKLKPVQQKLSTLQKLILVVLFSSALYLRFYRTQDLLGFHFDQGRDALVIRNFLQNGKPFLIGPVTGLEGIFLGPLLYLIYIPLYFLGNGDPTLPAQFMSAIHLVAIWLLLRLGTKLSWPTGLLAASTYAYSSNIVSSNRWLSNPPPIMITSLFLIYAFRKIMDGNNKFWLLASAAIAASLQFEVASAIFYLPFIIGFLIWRWKNRPNVINAILSIGIFILSFVPQFVFEVRHDFIQTKNIHKALISDRSFGGSPIALFKTRIPFYSYTFGNKLFAYNDQIIAWGIPILLIFAALTFNSWKSPFTKLLIFFISTPLIFYLFFQGNFGNVYDYHFSGYFPAFILLVSIWLTANLKKTWGQISLILFIFFFSITNFPALKNKLTEDINGPISVFFTNQKKAVNWVYNDSSGKSFNVDVYVPPVIPYAYDYLFAWIGDLNSRQPSPSLEPLLYTVVEPDPPHPERLAAWRERQSRIGKVEETVQFGGITVERRTRL